jgi:L-arabinose isomerase
MERAMKTTAGLLPFYLKLYDDHQPDRRNGFNGFVARIAAGLEARGIAVATAPVSRVNGEFEQSIRELEAGGADCIITLHLAYSPSLEALESFCRTRLPIILLDTTMDADFGLSVSPTRIMYNHGVHGVMDFASMLRRRRRPFEIVAGHDSDPSVLDRVAGYVRAARAARELRGSRVLRVGQAFEGMGDFSVPEEVLVDALGIRADTVGLDALDRAAVQVSARDVASEVAEDRVRYVCELTEAAHARSVRVGLGLRRLLDAGGYHALSVNFQAFDRADRPADTMPFLEISKAMARGLGYGGEGDVLTAALVGALNRAFGAVTFTEIFCADWAGGLLFLSHMGEINPALASDTPRILEKPFFIGGSRDPAVLTCAVRPGPAALVNLAPGPDDSFTLIVAPVEVLAETAALDPAMRDGVRAWVRPPGEVASFLEAYSRAGGTHHSALVLGEYADAVAAFGRMVGLDVVEIRG